MQSNGSMMQLVAKWTPVSTVYRKINVKMDGHAVLRRHGEGDQDPYMSQWRDSMLDHMHPCGTDDGII